VFTRGSTVATGVFRWTIGKGTSTGVGALAVTGFGIQVTGTALEGIVHNGTTLDTVDLGKTIALNIANVILIDFDPASGAVYWYDYDGTLLGSSTGIPSGASSGISVMQMEAQNAGTAADFLILMHSIKFWIDHEASV
jgi:hypothetical protein